jgi:vitamin B12 transporter
MISVHASISDRQETAAVGAARRRLLWGASVLLLLATSALDGFASDGMESGGAERPAGRQSPSQPLDTLFVVSPIVVEAKRRTPDAGLFDRSGFVAAVDLTRRRERVEDLAHVLSQMVGVSIRQYGGLGDFATASIRGSSANQVKLFFDGVPMNDAYTGVANLADLPLGGVQRVEVYRGFAPPRLGSSAVGGAVNLVTADPDHWKRGSFLSDIELFASYGSFDTSRLQLSAWLHPSRTRVFVHVGTTNSLGSFPFLNDNGTPLNPNDDVTAVRANNDFDSWNALGRLDLDLPGLKSFSFTHDAYHRDQGVAGFGYHQSTTARYRRDRRLSNLRLETQPFLAKQLQASATGYYSDTNEQFHDPDGTISLERQSTDNMILGWGGLGSVKWLVPVVPVTLQCVVEGRTEEFRPADNLPTRYEGPTRSRRARTIVAAADVYLLRQTLVLSPAERWEAHVDEFYDEASSPRLPPSPHGRIARHQHTPSIGVRWNPHSTITVKGNIGRYYRLPTFLELFGNLGTVTGEADLEPEVGLNRDIGVVLNVLRMGPVHSIYAEVVYLDNEVDNLILFFPNSQFTVKPTNIGKAEIKGWEFSLAALVGRRLQVCGNYTRLDTKDTSAIPYYRGNELPARPRDDVNVSLTLLAARWKLTYEIHYVGANYLDRANLRVVAARDIHNLVFKLETPVEGLSVTIEGRNFTDNQTSDVSGFPLPGRTLFSTVGYKL